MATEKRHKAPASTSKGNSLIIQLPTTSANLASSIDRNNNINSEILVEHNNLEQNNLFNFCANHIEGAATATNQHHHRHRPAAYDAEAEQVARGGGSLLLPGRPLSPAHTGHQQLQHHHHLHLHQHRHHRNRLNNFHNHIQQHSPMSQATRHQSSERLTQTETDSDQESITPPPNYHEIPGVVPAYQGRSSGPPPAYDDVVNPNALPPSYQSLFGQVREARKSSNGLVNLLRQLFLVLIGTIGCTIVIGFLLLIPITMILVGIVYVNDCRAENIPSFLVVGGFVWILKNVLNCYNQFKKDASASNRPPPRRQPIASPSTSSPSLSSSSSEAAATAATTMAAATTAPTTTAAAASSPSMSSSAFSSSSSSSSSSSASTGAGSASISIVGETAPEAGQASQIDDAQTASRTDSSGAELQQAPSSSSATTRRTQPALYHLNQAQINHIRHPPMIGLTSYKCESILNYFLIVWFLAGCIVVYRIYEPDYDNPSSANYCNRLVYLYAFWLMTSAFILTAVILSCLCCLMASSLMSCRDHRRR